MSLVPDYKITAEDLDGLDKKTKDGLDPLVSALNYTIPLLVSTVNSTPIIDWVSFTFTTGTIAAASFPLAFSSIVKNVKGVSFGNFQPVGAGADYTNPWAMQGWKVNAQGNIAINFITNLQPNTKYSVTFKVE